MEEVTILPSTCSTINSLKVKKIISKKSKGKEKTSTVEKVVSALTNDSTKVVGKQPRCVSEAWKHYNITWKDNKKVAAHCKHCGQSVPCDSVQNGTSSARSHARTCKGNPDNDKSSNLQQSVLGFQPLGSSSEPAPYKSNWVFDCKAAREAFVKKMIIDQDAFCEFQKPGWKVLMPVILPPYFRLPGRAQFARDCISMYEKLKGELREFFTSTKQRVSLTTDTWTSSNQKINYMCVTAHYIDDDWVLQKKIIYFVPIVSHKGEDLGMVLEYCLKEEWGI